MLIVKKKRYKKIDSVPILSHYSNLLYLVPTMSMLALSILGLVCINPISHISSAYAVADNINLSANSDDNTASLTIAGDLAQSTPATAGGDTAYRSNIVTVSANRIDNYNVYIYGPEELKNSSTNTVALTGANHTLGSEMLENTWGYAWSNNIADSSNESNATLHYNSLSSKGSSLEDGKTGEKVVNGTVNFSRKLSFAAKFASFMPEGHYQADVILALVINPKTTAFSGITTMQEMTPDICRIAEENETRQLIDKRDGKSYWVAKLKDGNCWMTQNLDFDIPATLDPATTDVDSTMASNATKINAIPEWTSSETSIQYYDPGDLYYIGDGDHGYSGTCSPTGNNTTTDLLNCPNSSGGQKFVGRSSSTTPQDEHWHIGNYYSWGAAVAADSNTLKLSTDGMTAPNSICPKGWQLPLSGKGNDSRSGSFFNLLNQTSGSKLNPNYDAGYNNKNNAGVISDTLGDKMYNDPLYFVYAGLLSGSALWWAGGAGSYWSSVVQSASDAYYLIFNLGLYPSGFDYRGYGYAVRCVAR